MNDNEEAATDMRWVVTLQKQNPMLSMCVDSAHQKMIIRGRMLIDARHTLQVQERELSSDAVSSDLGTGKNWLLP